MKRAGWWLFNFAAGVGVVLFLATAVVWVRSYFISDRWYYLRASPEGEGTRFSQYLLNSGAGVIGCAEVQQWVGGTPAQFMAQRASQGAAGNRHYTVPSTQPGLQFASRSFMGISYGTLAFGRKDYGREVVAPLWELTLAWAALPFIWLMRWRSLRRKRLAGCCRICGYDLRATPERCPECVTVVQRTVEGAGGGGA